MKSMTGFGHQDFRDEKYDITVEIKTVNHRYKDFFIKIPRVLNANEEKIRKRIGEVLTRGRIEVYIRFNEIGNNNTSLSLNTNLVKDYLTILNEIKGMDDAIDSRIDLSLIAKFPDVIDIQQTNGDDDVYWDVLSPILDEVLNQVVLSRAREGLSMKQDIEQHCGLLDKIVIDISKRAPKMLETYEANIKAKVMEYLNSTDIDEQRILTEVAIMGDKLAIDEEITRLKTHIKRLKEMLETEESPIGRKLDFLIQEMNREINTIGSKVNDVEIAGMVVEAKNEIEKIREQVQNIE